MSADYRQALLRVAASMNEAGVTPLTIQDSVFNTWLAGLSQSPTTRSNYRRMGLTLWRAAIDAGLTANHIGKIRPVKAPVLPPVAWSRDELFSLLNHIETLRGEFSSGCKQRAFWKAWVHLGYESGLRFGDMHELRCSSVRGRRLTVMQHKTQRPIGKVLSNDCSSALIDLMARSPDGTVFKWALSRRWVMVSFKGVCSGAGLPGSTKWLRRSGATAVEMASPGSAQRFLGHLSPGLAQKHYLDPSLLADSVPAPPSLSRSSSLDPQLASVS